MSTWMNNYLQEAMSPIMEQLIMFHDHTMMLITMIMAMGTLMLTFININIKQKYKLILTSKTNNMNIMN